MLFAALIATPAAAFLTTQSLLLFYLVFPFSALFSLDWKFFRNAALLIPAPAAVLCWAWLSENDAAFHRSLRWICALSAGVYFARSLGPGGISLVLRSFYRCSFLTALADSIHTAGSAAASAGEVWREADSFPFGERIVHTLTGSIKAGKPVKDSVPDAFPVAIAVISWIFFIAVLSGRLN
ncbi:hypothetical protein CSA37_13145 [Candidatus Fermentibacteria bacterium]|nr:MAG: hypothetical protein CSA37_13145 [Candidatus Fermentibacteria bacterium]